MERQPILGDHFYPADESARDRRAGELLDAVGATAEQARVTIVPHGSLDFAGPIAAEAIARIDVPDVVVVLAAAHAGLAPRGSIATVGAYRLPGTRIPVDTRFAEDLAGLAMLHEETNAHAREHAIEAVLPLLVRRNPRMRVVPVVFGPMPHATTVRIGNALADCVNNHGRDVLVVATTALSAYLPAADAASLDARTIARIEALDGIGLYEIVAERPEALDSIVPVSIALAAARALGRDNAITTKHRILTPDIDRPSQCVGLGSFIVR